MDKKMWIFTGCGNCVKGYYPTGSNDLHCLDTKKVVDEYGEFPPWCPIPNSTVAAIEAKNAELVKAVVEIRKSDSGAWLKDCSMMMYTCGDGRYKRQELRALLDKLYAIVS